MLSVRRCKGKIGGNQAQGENREEWREISERAWFFHRVDTWNNFWMILIAKTARFGSILVVPGKSEYFLYNGWKQCTDP